MKSKKLNIKLCSAVLYFCFSFVFSNQVQLITTHKKNNGTLLRIVTSSILEIENIAGWKGQENWFYITLNGTSLSASSRDYITFEPPLVDIEITENNESVQLGYLFEKPIEDFEIFHSNASRVVLVQVWESLNDSVRYELRTSEKVNQNRVFSLPKNESKGSPFYDSFVYAKEKYGSEKYFVWYNNWYSTEDNPTETNMEDRSRNDSDFVDPTLESKKEIQTLSKDPKPLVVKKKKIKVSGPPVLQPQKIEVVSIDISNILAKGLLFSGINRPKEIKILQESLLSLGYYLGSSGLGVDGVDGDFGAATEAAVIQFQLDRGFNSFNVDGVVGDETYRELIRALSGEESVVVKRKTQREVLKTIKSEKDLEPLNKNLRVVMNNNFGSLIQKEHQTAKELLNQTPVKTEIKRVTRKLKNSEEVKLLPTDMTKRKTFLKLSCNLDGANVFIDGSLIGKTPLPKKLTVTPGWHRVRVINPDALPQKYAMAIPDYQDIYVPQGKTQKVRINLATEEEEEEKNNECCLPV